MAGTVGLVATVTNVANTLFAIKTTALATTQFSPPPSPPTLIDTAARWDGTKYIEMPLPKDPDTAESDAKKAKRGLAKRSFQNEPIAVPGAHQRLIKRRRKQDFGGSVSSEEKGESPHMSKRWLVATLIGGAAGAALAPGLPSQVMGWKNEHEKPPFNPYDPDMLKPKDPLAVAASIPGQPLPDVTTPAPPVYDPRSGPQQLGAVKFPAYAYGSSAYGSSAYGSPANTSPTPGYGQPNTPADAPPRSPSMPGGAAGSYGADSYGAGAYAGGVSNVGSSYGPEALESPPLPRPIRLYARELSYMTSKSMAILTALPQQSHSRSVSSLAADRGLKSRVVLLLAASSRCCTEESRTPGGDK